MTRRTYVLTLLACLAGAGLALYAVTRPWSAEVTPRTGMSDLRTVRTGAETQPWVVGLAVVALAGTGALLATAGRLRRILGALLALAGGGVAIGAAAGLTGSGGTVWPVVCGVGGAVIAAGGITAARHGHQWPGMSARYERRPATGVARDGSDHRAAWDALDRGDDPTA